MANIFPIDFEEKLTMAQDDFILFSDSEDGNKIKKAQYKNLKGEKGDTGNPGAAATITVGSTTTGEPGTTASVTNSGTSSAAVFNFTIPKGAKGQDGTDGEAATITVGSTTTLPAGSSATVTNSGTSQDAILEFGIPQGDQGVGVDVEDQTLIILGSGGTGSGDVVGPSSAIDGHLAVFKGTTGKVIMDGGAIPTLTFAKIAGNPTDNTNLANALNGKQDVSNLVTSVSSSSTDSQYPSAKLFYDTCGDIETLINAL